MTRQAGEGSHRTPPPFAEGDGWCCSRCGSTSSNQKVIVTVDADQVERSRPICIDQQRCQQRAVRQAAKRAKQESL